MLITACCGDKKMSLKTALLGEMLWTLRLISSKAVVFRVCLEGFWEMQWLCHVCFMARLCIFLSLESKNVVHLRFSCILLPSSTWSYLIRVMGNFVPNSLVKFWQSICILFPHYQVVYVIFFNLYHLLVTYPWYVSVLMSGYCTEQVQMIHFACTNWGETHHWANFWATFIRNLWHVLKSPEQRVQSDNYDSHLQNKHLSKWLIIFCHGWFSSVILYWWKLPKSDLCFCCRWTVWFVCYQFVC